MKLYILLVLVIIVSAHANKRTRRKRNGNKHRRERISRLPGVHKMPKFHMYSGYLDSGNGDQLFYWLNEAESRSDERLILWLNGGPGCSSLFGLMKENGPFDYDGEKKTLKRSNYSWNRLGATLYLDSPVGTGFSYTKGTTKADDLTDERTAKSTLIALKHFFTLYPRFKDADLYLSGESYAGIYLPMLAAEILKHGETLAKNLKGVLLGNPLLGMKLNDESRVEYFYSHGFIGRPLYDELKSDFCRNKNKGRRRPGCARAERKFRTIFDNPALSTYNYAQDSPCNVPVEKVEESEFDDSSYDKQEIDSDYNVTSDYYDYAYDEDIYFDFGNLGYIDHEDYEDVEVKLTFDEVKKLIDEVNADKPALTIENINKGMLPGRSYLERLEHMGKTNRTIMKIKNFLNHYIDSIHGFDEVTCQLNIKFSQYFERDDVIKAIHAKNITFNACSSHIGSKYHRTVSDVSEYVKTINKAGVAVLLYFGDHDLMCPFITGEKFVLKTGINRTKDRGPWYVKKGTSKTVGGFLEKFNNLWFATVKGAGHMAPADKPFETFTLVRRFMSKH